MMARFDGIKVGDKVVIRPRGRWQGRYVASVERVTRTQFVAGGIRFAKTGGEVGGDKWHSAAANPATPDLLAAVALEARHSDALNRLRRLRDEIRTITNDLDRPDERDGSIEILEAAVADLDAALAKLREVE